MFWRVVFVLNGGKGEEGVMQGRSEHCQARVGGVVCVVVERSQKACRRSIIGLTSFKKLKISLRYRNN